MLDGNPLDGEVEERVEEVRRRHDRTRDAFGRIGAAFRELDRKTLIFSERAVPISPNAWWIGIIHRVGFVGRPPAPKRRVR